MNPTTMNIAKASIRDGVWTIQTHWLPIVAAAFCPVLGLKLLTFAGLCADDETMRIMMSTTGVVTLFGVTLALLVSGVIHYIVQEHRMKYIDYSKVKFPSIDGQLESVEE